MILKELREKNPGLTEEELKKKADDMLKNYENMSDKEKANI